MNKATDPESVAFKRSFSVDNFSSLIFENSLKINSYALSKMVATMMVRRQLILLCFFLNFKTNKARNVNKVSGARIWGSLTKIGASGAKVGAFGAKIGGSGANIGGSVAKIWGSLAKFIEASGMKNGPLRPGFEALGPILGHLGISLVALGSRFGVMGQDCRLWGKYLGLLGQ